MDSACARSFWCASASFAGTRVGWSQQHVACEPSGFERWVQHDVPEHIFADQLIVLALQDHTGLQPRLLVEVERAFEYAAVLRAIIGPAQGVAKPVAGFLHLADAKVFDTQRPAVARG